MWPGSYFLQFLSHSYPSFPGWWAYQILLNLQNLLCLDNSPRSQSLKTFLDYPYFLLCFHKFWCFFIKFPWNSLFCWYLSLSLHIPTNKDSKFYGKIKFKTESFGDEDWGKNCCPCQGACIHHNQILCLRPGFRNRQNIFHYQKQGGENIYNYQKIIMASI